MQEAGTYVDAAPLIALGIIDHLHILRILPQPVYVTDAVWEEVTVDTSKPGAKEVLSAEQEGILTRTRRGDAGAYPELGKGESSVFSAAIGTGAIVVMDDIDAHKRRAAHGALRAGIHTVYTTASLLIVAKRVGVIREVRPLMDELIKRGFGIAGSEYALTLEWAGEDD